jgi:hypothetical protein
MKKVLAFAKKNPVYIATIHAIGGVGVGILIASPIAGEHPIRWGVALLIASLLGHLYMWFA